MKTDLYTKAVLTVIAISLAGIAIQLTSQDAHAQGRVQLVAVCNPDGRNCADINSDFQLRITSGR